MNKDYKIWSGKKSEIENTAIARVFFFDREVWWCSVGENVGYEEDGKGKNFARPVLVFKKFNKEIFWALPLSTQVKGVKFYSPVHLPDKLERVAIISQLRLTDAKRLIDRIGIITAENYLDIQKAVINLCDLQPPPDVV
ncbi:MAG: type II toxin-antitoxin system PemK/MazF family toxin [bacterium]